MCDDITKVIANLQPIQVDHGKVRDIYIYHRTVDPDVDDDGFLSDFIVMHPTDRISAIDYPLASSIPNKGMNIQRISINNKLKVEELGIIATDFITDEYFEMPVLHQTEEMQGCCEMVDKAEPIPLEFIASGYLTGSNLREYRKYGTINGEVYPMGLQDGDRLPWINVRVTTKAPAGQHDENVDSDYVCEIMGESLAKRAIDVTRQLYTIFAAYYWDLGIVMPDTKFEFGLVDHELVLIDEVCTPDSSRFWSLESYQPGHPQKSYDKDEVREFVRQYLAEREAAGKPVGKIVLPDELCQRTAERYGEIADLITGSTAEEYLAELSRALSEPGD